MDGRLATVGRKAGWKLCWENSHQGNRAKRKMGCKRETKHTEHSTPVLPKNRCAIAPFGGGWRCNRSWDYLVAAIVRESAFAFAGSTKCAVQKGRPETINPSGRLFCLVVRPSATPFIISGRLLHQTFNKIYSVQNGETKTILIITS